MTSCSFWRPLLARCRYYLIFKLHLCKTAIIGVPPSRRPTLLSIAAAQRAKETMKRGAYIKLDEKTKIRISKYSSENGIGAAARRFSQLRYGTEVR